MNRKPIAVLLALAASLTALVFTSGTANALVWPNNPPAPTTTFPPQGKPDATICLVEQTTITEVKELYDEAKLAYDTQVKLVLNGGAAVQDATVAQEALDKVAIQLNDAKYAYATCQNTNAKPVPADQACITIALELNRLKDKLAIVQNLQDIAQWRVDSAQAIAVQGLPGSDVALNAAKTALKVAQTQTTKAGLLLDAQRKVATDKGCKNAERPAPVPAPPPPPNPAPVGATPSDSSIGGPTSLPSDTATDAPSDTASGAPSDLPTDSATNAPTDTSSNPPTDSASPAPSAS